jgi:hypothetical protein
MHQDFNYFGIHNLFDTVAIFLFGLEQWTRSRYSIEPRVFVFKMMNVDRQRDRKELAMVHFESWRAVYSYLLFTDTGCAFAP